MATATGHITKNAGICGGDACLRGHRIPVWVLANFRHLGGSDEDILQAYSALTSADLQAVWKYAATHPDEISRAIQENENTV